MDYKKISQDVVDHVGGISNIKGATHCVTRLRLILNDETKYDRKALENIEGVKGVLFNSGQLILKQSSCLLLKLNNLRRKYRGNSCL